MAEHFDKDGRQISLRQWSALFEDMEYRRVAEDTVGECWISTVWLGLDHGFGLRDEPLIFETMVFDNSEGGLAESAEVMRRVGMSGQAELGPEKYMARYATLEDVRKGHEAAVIAVTNDLLEPTNEHEKGQA